MSFGNLMTAFEKQLDMVHSETCQAKMRYTFNDLTFLIVIKSNGHFKVFQTNELKVYLKIKHYFYVDRHFA